jgi:HlyD family secretion protein
MKKFIIVIVVLVLIGIGLLTFNRFQAQAQSEAINNLQTETARRGDLNITIGATGVVSAEQSAILTWKTSGTVERVYVKAGDLVSTGEPLANLESGTLPREIILAKAELIEAQRALDDLNHSRTEQALAQKAVEDAQEALEDAAHPETLQAEALELLANAKEAVEDAEMALYIVQKPVSQSAIDQVYANMLLKERTYNETRKQVNRFERRLNKPKSELMPWESQSLYRRILKVLNLKLANDQIVYEQSAEKYNKLLEPVDPTDLAIAEANLALANAQLAQAEREWERVKDGLGEADIAVLKAKLADAQREWGRLKHGPNEDDIIAAQARITAAKSALNQTTILAPFNGVITQVNSKSGDQVSPGEIAFRLDDTSRLIVDVNVSEVDVNHIYPGQPVILTFDSILAKEYDGLVLEVPPVGEVVQGVANFRVKIEITNPDEKIKPAMTSTTTFLINQLEDVLLVPNRALRFIEGQRVVYILQNGQLVPIEVTLGASSDTYSQVLESDLKPGDPIVTDPSEDLLEREADFSLQMQRQNN